MSYTTGICAALNIVLNFLLIPSLSHIGASIATVITEGAVFLFLYSFVKKSGLGVRPWQVIRGPAVSAALMVAVILLLPGLHLLALVPLAGAVYLGALVLQRGIGKEEWALARSLIRR